MVRDGSWTEQPHEKTAAFSEIVDLFIEGRLRKNAARFEENFDRA